MMVDMVERFILSHGHVVTVLDGGIIVSGLHSSPFLPLVLHVAGSTFTLLDTRIHLRAFVHELSRPAVMERFLIYETSI